MADQGEEVKPTYELRYEAIIFITIACLSVVITVLLRKYVSRKSHQNNDLYHVSGQIRQLQNRSGIQDSKIRRLKEEKDGMSTDIARAREQLQAMESKYESLKAAHQRLKEAYNGIQRDKDTALKRLSSVIGDRLVRNNPSIADLSDTYRPTKLADMSGELYDNEWTSAYASLNERNFSDNECTDILLKIVMQTHDYCQSQAITGMDVLVNKDKEVVSKMKELLKANSDRIIPNMYKVFYADFCGAIDKVWPGIHHLSDIQIYTEKTFSLCWYMAVQDPPVVFKQDADNVAMSQGLPFPRDLYREYTRRGPYIEFIVWPMLLLHDGGPILSKGVAQGCKSKP